MALAHTVLQLNTLKKYLLLPRSVTRVSNYTDGEWLSGVPIRSVCWRSVMNIRLAKHRSIASCYLIEGRHHLPARNYERRDGEHHYEEIHPGADEELSQRSVVCSRSRQPQIWTSRMTSQKVGDESGFSAGFRLGGHRARRSARHIRDRSWARRCRKSDLPFSGMPACGSRSDRSQSFGGAPVHRHRRREHH